MDAKPIPIPTPETREFWEAANRGELLFQRCGGCGEVQFYPRPFCAKCLSEQLTWERSAGGGTIHTFTVVHRPPSAAFKADVPYIIAMVDLDEGFRMMMNVRNCAPEDPAIGARVRIIFEPAGDSGQSLPQAELER